MDNFAIDQQLKRSQRITLHGHKSTINTVRWSPDGTIIASGGKDKHLNIHRVKDCNLIADKQQTTHGHKDELDFICWNADNPTLLATAAADRMLKIWDLRFVEPIATIKINDEAVGLSWSNSGSTIALGDKADVVSFVDIRNGWKITNDQRCPFEICDLAWNKEDDLLHLVTGDGKMHIYSYPKMQNLMTCDAFSSPCTCIRFDRSGKYFALGSNDAISTVWDSPNVACIQAISRLESPIHSVAFSYDGRYLATGSVEDHIIDVADAQTGQQILPIELASKCFSLDFHPKDYILAYVVNDHEHYRDMGTIKIIGFPDRQSKLYG